jgi:hypothetical protein
MRLEKRDLLLASLLSRNKQIKIVYNNLLYVYSQNLQELIKHLVTSYQGILLILPAPKLRRLVLSNIL